MYIKFQEILREIGELEPLLWAIELISILFHLSSLLFLDAIRLCRSMHTTITFNISHLHFP